MKRILLQIMLAVMITPSVCIAQGGKPPDKPKERIIEKPKPTPAPTPKKNWLSNALF